MSDWVRVGATADIAPGTGVRLDVGDEAIAVWNVDGEFYATSDVCTHEETSLVDGDLWDDVVECPLHGAQFNVRTGAVLALPAIFPLPTYPVRVEDDAVYVGVNGQ